MVHFNSKIILFGEYAVLSGAKLLAIPFPKFTGKLSIPGSDTKLSDNIISSNNTLKNLFDHINNLGKELKFNSDSFKHDLNQGIFFESNIPQNYGLGSSGALVAAIFDRYFCSRQNFHKSSMNKTQLQNQLASIESYFHGNSSGADPLVSYLNKAIVINGKTPEIFRHLNDLSIFLIDTQNTGITKDLVSVYRIKEASLKLKTNIETFVDKTNKVIDNYTDSNTHLFKMIQEHAAIEKQLLSEMFIKVNGLQNIEQEYNDNLAIKLCGSGGGGFLLAFCYKNKFAEINQKLNTQNITTIAL